MKIFKQGISLFSAFLLLAGSFAQAAEIPAESDLVDAETIAEAQATMESDEFFDYLSNLPGANTTNEYDMIVEAQEEARIRQLTRSSEEGDEDLLALDMREYYYGLKELSSEELAGLGYDEARINIIQNFEGTEDEMRRASASITGYLTCTSKSFASSKSSAAMKYTFSVNGVFSQKYNDCVLIGNVNDFVFELVQNAGHTDLNYEARNAPDKFSKVASAKVAPNTGGTTAISSFEYTVYRPFSASQNYPYDIKSGTMTATFVNYNASKQVYFTSEYKHTSKSRDVSSLLDAGVSCVEGSFIQGLKSVAEFVLAADTKAESSNHQELYVHS